MKKKSSSRQVVVKKISAYPFPAQLILNSPQPTQGQVIKITNDGALVDIGSAFLKLGITGTINFKLPTFQSELQIQCKVLKVQDRAISKTTTVSQETKMAQKTASTPPQVAPVGIKPKVQVIRIIEVRFLILSDANKSQIRQFLASIKQRKCES